MGPVVLCLVHFWTSPDSPLETLQKLNPWYKEPPPSQDFCPTSYSGNLNATATVCVDMEPVPGNNEMDNTTKLIIADTAIGYGWKPSITHHTFTQWGGPEEVWHWVNHTESKKGTVEKGYCYEHIREALCQKFDDLEDSVPEAQCVSVQDSLGNTRSFVWGTDMQKVEATECLYGMHKDNCVSIDNNLNRLDHVVFHELENSK